MSETQDLRVRVVPKLADSASTVLGLVNPIAGITSVIAQNLLKNPLGQIFSYDYVITGTWAEPKVQKGRPGPAVGPGEPDAEPVN